MNHPRHPAHSAVHWGYVALTRYAAQQLYAPARLLDFTPGIVRVPVNQQPIDLVRGGQHRGSPCRGLAGRCAYRDRGQGAATNPKIPWSLTRVSCAAPG